MSNKTADFYRLDADTTIVADGFLLLTSLKEVHCTLAEGAHNQFGDLGWIARIEMHVERVVERIMKEEIRIEKNFKRKKK